jgi:hypothetical protein
MAYRLMPTLTDGGGGGGGGGGNDDDSTDDGDDDADDGASDKGPAVPWAHLLDDKGNGFFPITKRMKLFWTELYEEFPNE